MGKISEIFNFDNIGGKIKNLAKWSCWITILLIWIAAPISFIGLVSDDWTAYLCWIPLVGAIIVPIFVWIGSWAMYAFGEFVEDIHAMRNKEGTTKEVNAKREAEEKAKREAEEKAKCEAVENGMEPEQPSGEKCQLCDKYFDHLTYCEIKDDFGTRYRNICDDCVQKHNAKPQK